MERNDDDNDDEGGMFLAHVCQLFDSICEGGCNFKFKILRTTEDVASDCFPVKRSINIDYLLLASSGLSTCDLNWHLIMLEKF